MMTFVRGSRPPLAGVPFAIEGDPKAARAAQTIVLELGGLPFTIRKEYKEAYHAWGMFASPLLDALLAVSERVAVAAGVRRKAARERMLPILRQTLANYARLGAAASFSGSISKCCAKFREPGKSTLRWRGRRSAIFPLRIVRR
jgi:predicted short-subunit dehydrogenase-like oxidoreductase (DUF2520 family)